MALARSRSRVGRRGTFVHRGFVIVIDKIATAARRFDNQ